MENGKDILTRWRSHLSSHKDSSLPVTKFWEDVKVKKEKKAPWLRWQDAKSRKQLHLGPAGAAGTTCSIFKYEP